MRYKKADNELLEADLTPMIDMTFQLIAFFMLIINFTEAEQDQRIQLPKSELARPPEQPFEVALTIQLMKDSKTDQELIIYGGEVMPLANLQRVLAREREYLTRTKRSPADATIIIRADGRAKTGVVQQIIETCQEVGFEQFALRAQQEEAG